MTIRTKLTLWYTAILCLSTVLIVSLSYREFMRELRLSEQQPHHDEEGEQDGWEDVVQISISCGIPAAILGLAGGWWLMRKALSPVTAITEAAKRINERNIHETLARTGNGDELDQLTDVFNAMTARLSDSFEQIREFTLHASHELQTPLTVMQGELETALREEDLTETHRERILSQLDEIQRLTQIVNGLTLLTKADAGQLVLKKEPVALNELVRESYEDAKILAQPHGIHVHLGRCESLMIQGDRHRLRQLLLNLVDNAIKYNFPNGTVEIELQKNDAAAELTIQNTGKGISPERLPRVFDRFFRCNEIQDYDIEGCGLGLSISKWIVSAHDGKISLQSEPQKLTVVTVSFPLRA